jgi:hypothetical protein
MSVYISAARSAPRSDPANNQDFLPSARPRRARRDCGGAADQGLVKAKKEVYIRDDFSVLLALSKRGSKAHV